MINDYGITVKPITSRNLQANTILERVHQRIGNILRTFKIQNMVLDEKNPWDGILASTILTLRATVHTTTQCTPTQVIFGCNSIINRPHDLDWEIIRKRKHDIINKGNERVIRNRIKHMYKQGGKVLLNNMWKA